MLYCKGVQKGDMLECLNVFFIDRKEHQYFKSEKEGGPVTAQKKR